MTEEQTAKQRADEQAKELRKLLRLLTQSALSVRCAGRHGDWIDIRGTNDGKMFTHLEKVVVSELMNKLGLTAHWAGFATIPPRLIEQAVEEGQKMVEEARKNET